MVTFIAYFDVFLNYSSFFFGILFDQVDVMFLGLDCSNYLAIVAVVAVVIQRQDVLVYVVYVDCFEDHDDKSDQRRPVEVRLVLFFHFCN